MANQNLDDITWEALSNRLKQLAWINELRVEVLARLLREAGIGKKKFMKLLQDMQLEYPVQRSKLLIIRL